MSSPEAALIRAVYEYARSVTGLHPVKLTLTLADNRRRSLDLPPEPPPGPPPPPGPAVILSATGEMIVGVVRERGPVAAKAVIERTGIERSRCYVLLEDLKDRGVLREGSDGYELADG